jgi:hypothetical protein
MCEWLHAADGEPVTKTKAVSENGGQTISPFGLIWTYLRHAHVVSVCPRLGAVATCY